MSCQPCDNSYSVKYKIMQMLARICQRAALLGSALLLCTGLAAHADEIQDINKLFKQGQQDKALSKVNTYLAAKPKDAQARFLKGLILTEQGKANDAIRIFAELTEDFPELPEPYNNLAVLHASQGQYDKAKNSLEMAIRTHPSYATAHENLGDIYAKMASQAYDRALQLDRSNTTTQTKLAMIKDLFTGNSKTTKSNKDKRPITIAAAEPVVAEPAETPAVPADSAATSEPALARAASTEPVAAEPASIAEPAPAVRPFAKKSTRNSREVLNVVREWASTWSTKNVKGYLALYAPDFKVPGGESRDAWEAQRRERISKPKSIRVGISGANVRFIDDDHASVSFKQSYRASHLNTSTRKTLVLERTDSGWLIQEERTGD